MVKIIVRNKQDGIVHIGDITTREPPATITVNGRIYTHQGTENPMGNVIYRPPSVARRTLSTAKPNPD